MCTHLPVSVVHVLLGLFAWNELTASDQWKDFWSMCVLAAGG